MLIAGLGFMLTPIISKVSTMLGGERAPLMASSAIAWATLPLVLLLIKDLEVCFLQFSQNNFVFRSQIQLKNQKEKRKKRLRLQNPYPVLNCYVKMRIFVYCFYLKFCSYHRLLLSSVQCRSI